MRFLFVHAGFPAQFRFVVPMLAASGHKVVFATTSRALSIEGVDKIYFDESDGKESSHSNLSNALFLLKKKGFLPDLTVIHGGNGYAAEVVRVFPDRPVTGLFEWYFDETSDIFQEFPATQTSESYQKAVRQRNRLILDDLVICKRGFTSTLAQLHSFPAALQPSLNVLHEGTASGFFTPVVEKPTCFQADTFEIHASGGPVLTYVARSFEPVRQFHIFMQALGQLQRSGKTFQTVLVGSKNPVYGKHTGLNETWFEELVAKYNIDPARFHYSYYLSQESYRSLLHFSDVHVYLTRPFVPSWSLLEAMLCGCCVVSNDTASVREFVTDSQTGILVPDENPEKLAAAILALLQNPDRRSNLGKLAANFAHDRYSLSKNIAPYLRFLFQLALEHRNPGS